MRTEVVPLSVCCPDCGKRQKVGEGNRAYCDHGFPEKTERSVLLIGANTGKPVKVENPAPEALTLTIDEVIQRKGGCPRGNCE